MRTVFSTNDTFPGVILSWVSSLSLGVTLSMSRAVRESESLQRRILFVHEFSKKYYSFPS